jgi:hypothetical protein
MEKTMEDKNYELDCLVRSIKEVEMAKAKKPEMYQKALAELKSDAKIIGSIDDLKKAYKKVTKQEDDDEDDA